MFSCVLLCSHIDACIVKFGAWIQYIVNYGNVLKKYYQVFITVKLYLQWLEVVQINLSLEMLRFLRYTLYHHCVTGHVHSSLTALCLRWRCLRWRWLCWRWLHMFLVTVWRRCVYVDAGYMCFLLQFDGVVFTLTLVTYVSCYSLTALCLRWRWLHVFLVTVRRRCVYVDAGYTICCSDDWGSVDAPVSLCIHTLWFIEFIVYGVYGS